MRVEISRTVIETLVNHDVDDYIMNAVYALCRGNERIAAIKLFKSHLHHLGFTGVGLLESKNFVDGYYEKRYRQLCPDD